MRSKSMMAALALVLGAGVAIAPAHAKTCKDVVTAKSRSAVQRGDAVREQRARDKAIRNWSVRARSTYGWSYRFWHRAEDKKIECGGGASAKHCTASAKPCSLF